MACINTDRWTWMGSEIMPELGLSPGHQSATVEMKVDGPQKCVRLAACINAHFGPIAKY